MTHSKSFSDYEPLRPSGTRKSSKASPNDEFGFDQPKSEKMPREFDEAQADFR
jgi:hypothetical protein